MSEMQTIQWFPGHMTKTKRQIQSSLKLVDAVAEIIDARIPVSSRNPDLAKLVQNKPRVILLNKCDMANQTATKMWIDYFKKQNLVAIPVDCKSGRGLDKFAPAVNTVMSHKIARLKEKGMVNPTIRIMIVGIPNVGKSSFINKMVKKNRAKVEAGRALQEVINGIQLQRTLKCLTLRVCFGQGLTTRQSESILRSQVRLKTKFLISNFWR